MITSSRIAGPTRGLGQSRVHDHDLPVSIQITDSPWSKGKSDPEEKKRHKHKAPCGLPIQYPEGCGQYCSEGSGYGQDSGTEEEPTEYNASRSQRLLHVCHHAQHRTSKEERGHAYWVFDTCYKDSKRVDAPEHPCEHADTFTANTPRYESDHHGYTCTHHGLHQPYGHNMLAKKSVYSGEHEGIHRRAIVSFAKCPMREQVRCGLTIVQRILENKSRPAG